MGRLGRALGAIAPSAKRRLRGLIHSDRARRTQALPAAVRFRLARPRIGQRPVEFDIAGEMGLGAMLTQAVRVLRLAEHEGLRARIRFTNPLYASAPGRDWLGDLLVQTDAPEGPAALRVQVRNNWDYELLSPHSMPTLGEAAALFDRHFTLSAGIEAELALALDRLGPLDAAIGVHFRGTDKALEARLATSVQIVDAIGRVRAETGWTRLFLATDEPAFEAALRAALPDMTILTYAYAGITTAAGVPVHFSDADGHAKAMDAMMLILLLSRCGWLVRTPSYLSSWSQLLNPDLPTTLVAAEGLRFPRFPDREIIAAAAARDPFRIRDLA